MRYDFSINDKLTDYGKEWFDNILKELDSDKYYNSYIYGMSPKIKQYDKNILLLVNKLYNS